MNNGWVAAGWVDELTPHARHRPASDTRLATHTGTGRRVN